ncbi:MAG: hypothetical protein KatS3mg111_0522 [Pirellulaceae bacterium]|nr:MAG: hypothetical protein KatS3mg111_0522 [Pirellulaceae bacterium]
MSGTNPSTQRLRQLAILFASIDPAAQRQLALRLPTHIALQVRQMARALGDVSEEERRRVLEIFYHNVAPLKKNTEAGAFAFSAESARTGDQHQDFRGGRKSEQSAVMVDPAKPNAIDENHASSEEEGPEWTRLPVSTLSELLQHERPTVMAVVIQQLPLEKGVAILERLAPETSCQVVAVLARMDDVDPDVRSEIDRYLCEKLGEQVKEHSTADRCNERLRRLLQAAPSHLQRLWADAIELPAGLDGLGMANSEAARGAEHRSVGEPAMEGGATATMPATSAPIRDGSPRRGGDESATVEVEPEPVALPITGGEEQTAGAAAGDVDRTLWMLEFERLLDLPASVLARVLTSAGSETVLLALAGASPEFMKRFHRMLDRRDARRLDEQLAALGPLRLQDIDAAQQRLMELAERFSGRSTAGHAGAPGGVSTCCLKTEEWLRAMARILLGPIYVTSSNIRGNNG